METEPAVGVAPNVGAVWLCALCCGKHPVEFEALDGPVEEPLRRVRAQAGALKVHFWLADVLL